MPYNGVQALEDAWDIVSDNLLVFAIANIIILFLFIFVVSFLSVIFAHILGMGSRASILLSLLLNYLLLMPPWHTANMAAVRHGVKGITAGDFIITPKQAIASILSYWFSRLIVLLFSLLLIIPGIIAHCRLSLVLPYFIHEKTTSVWGSITKSSQLVRGNFVDLYALNAAMGFVSPFSVAVLGVGLLLFPPIVTGSIDAAFLIGLLTFIKALFVALPFGLLMIGSIPMDSIGLYNMYKFLETGQKPLKPSEQAPQ